MVPLGTQGRVRRRFLGLATGLAFVVAVGACSEIGTTSASPSSAPGSGIAATSNAPSSTPGSGTGPATRNTTPGTRLKLVDAYVATAVIPRGASGADAVGSGGIEVVQIPREFRPETAIHIDDEIVAKVALFQISPGTVIVQGLFIDPVMPPDARLVPVVPMPTVPARPPATTADGGVFVFVAKGPVRRGTKIETAAATGVIGEALAPIEIRPETAITSPDQLVGKVALFDLAPGTIIVDGMFVPPF